MQSSVTATTHHLRSSVLVLFSLTAMLARPADADGQEKRRIQANDLYRLRTASDVALAPDGERIAFVVTQIDSTENAYYSHIWVADVESVRARPYTRGQVRDRNPVWAPDGSKLAFQSNRDGDSQIYVLSMAGGEAQAVTDMETGASNPVWSPDGTKLLFTSRLTSRQLAEAPEGSYDSTDATPDLASADTAMWGSLEAIRNWLAKNASEEDPAVITRLDFQGERSLNPIEHWSHIYEHDLVTATTRRLTDGPFNHGKPQYSPDGRRIAFTATITDGIHPDYMRKNDLYLMDADGGNLQLIEIPGQSVSAAIWSPDGDRLVFASRDTARGSAANTELGLIALGMEGPGDQIRWLTEPLDRGVTGFAWGAEGRSIYFTAVVHGTVPIYRVRLRDGDIRQIVSGERGVRSFDVGPKTLAYVVTHPENPSELYAANADSDDERRVTELNTGWLASIQIQPHQGFWYRSFDDRRIQGWLIEPVNRQSGETYPLALEIHGGPHAMWGPGEATMWLEFQLLAANGYFVLYTNPRGSGGYGYDFKYAIHRAWGEGPMRDVLTAVDSVLARGVVDEDRMVVTGGSYAGYLTAYLVGHDHRFQAAVAQRGVYDLAFFFGEGNAWRLVPREFATYPWQDAEILRAESPITYAHLIQTPLLIIHSDNDLRTGVSQSEVLYRTLKVLRRQVEYVRYPREGHDLSRAGEPLLRIDRLLRILEFFDRYIQPQSPSTN